MGRHSEHSRDLVPVRAATVPAVRPAVQVPHHTTRSRQVRPRSRGRAALFAFAFAASVGFVLVNVVDPYSGAVASPYFKPAGLAGGDLQNVQVSAESAAATIVRDGYTVTPKPEPVPEPEPEPAEPASSGWAPPAGAPDPGSAKAIAYAIVTGWSWSEAEYSCLVALWDRESGWNVYAGNPSSGAYGIPQALPGDKMASAGPNWQSDAETQIRWGLGYITGRYGGACGAWAHSEDAGWY